MPTLARAWPEVKPAEGRRDDQAKVPKPGRAHMAVMTEKSADATAIRPFTIEIPESELEDMRARIAATRWPEKEGVEDASQGVQLATIQAVARYWLNEYDWR